MKDWWFNLALREKQTIFIGSIIIILLLSYLFLWAPLANKNTALRIQTQHNQELLEWMQNANQQIQELRKTLQSSAAQKTVSKLGMAQDIIAKSSLAGHMSQLHQAESDTVQFKLQKVDFDQMVILLNNLWKQHALITSQITVNATDKPGEVNADVMLNPA